VFRRFVHVCLVYLKKNLCFFFNFITHHSYNLKLDSIFIFALYMIIFMNLTSILSMMKLFFPCIFYDFFKYPGLSWNILFMIFQVLHLFLYLAMWDIYFFILFLKHTCIFYISLFFTNKKMARGASHAHELDMNFSFWIFLDKADPCVPIKEIVLDILLFHLWLSRHRHLYYTTTLSYRYNRTSETVVAFEVYHVLESISTTIFFQISSTREVCIPPFMPGRQPMYGATFYHSQVRGTHSLLSSRLMVYLLCYYLMLHVGYSSQMSLIS
jgi:hypothetical protein